MRPGRFIWEVELGKIKTALEIALEKVKDLEVTAEDLRQLRSEGKRRVVAETVNRFILGDGSTRELQRWKPDATASPELIEQRRQCGELLIDQLSPAADLVRIALGLRHIGYEDAARGIEAAQHMARGREEAVQQLRGQLEAEILAELEAMGISGSAVRPNMEVHPRWEEAVAEVDQQILHQIDSVRLRLKSLLLNAG